MGNSAIFTWGSKTPQSDGNSLLNTKCNSLSKPGESTWPQLVIKSLLFHSEVLYPISIDSNVPKSIQTRIVMIATALGSTVSPYFFHVQIFSFVKMSNK